ncbi:MAG: hypothetical protein JWM10_3439, partial [Myxococcaceae bacterium]|nr:hypothetical protein [Myxococcaceae bacterium]
MRGVAGWVALGVALAAGRAWGQTEPEAPAEP